MAVITISREFGSEGNYIGTEVANALNYRFVFKKEIEDVFEKYGMPAFENLYDAKTSFWSRFNEVRVKTMGFLTKVIRAIAHHDNIVIVGRCSYAVLQEFANVLHVRVQAPLTLKVERIKGEKITEPENVEQLVQQEDRNRENLLQVFYHTEWENTRAFDIMVDTGKIMPDLAVKWIVEAVRKMEEAKDVGAKTTAAIEVDPVLHEFVTRLLV